MAVSSCCQLYLYVVVLSTLMYKPNALTKPENMSAEIYCTGCELTVKELDTMLRSLSTRGITEAVDKALKYICKLDNFKKHELNAEKVLQVCEHIKDDAGLKQALTEEYDHEPGQQPLTSYLDITQRVCGSVLGACPTAERQEADSGDGDISFDAKMQDINIKPGKKVRVASPVNDMDMGKERMERMEKFRELKDLPEEERRERMKELRDEMEQDRANMKRKFQDPAQLDRLERIERMKELKDLPEMERRARLREMDQETMEARRNAHKPRQGRRNGHNEL